MSDKGFFKASVNGKLPVVVCLIAIAGLSLSGCTPNVVLEPAPDSNNPDCAQIMVRLPDQLGDLEQRFTTAQSTSAWGNPSAVLFRCGIEPVAASALPCVTAAEVDWLVDDSQAPQFRFISFGRVPAVEVIVDSELASGISALEGLGSAVSVIQADKTCTVATSE
jgi:hypothetical protein